MRQTEGYGGEDLEKRIRLGDEVRFVMRIKDIMRHVSNELWIKA